MRILIFIALVTLSIPQAYATQASTMASGSALAKPSMAMANPHYLVLAANKKLLQKPTSGMTMSKVKRKFGEPLKELPSTGKPPITRWVYDQFTVYFEGKHVIHAVTTL